jgi:hypothetical protein
VPPLARHRALAQAASDTAIHIVYVAQTSCPTCVINGVGSLSREACFPYSDAALLQPRYGDTPVC